MFSALILRLTYYDIILGSLHIFIRSQGVQMGFFTSFTTFNDKKLLKQLNKKGIQYTVSDLGMIDILPNEQGNYPSIDIDKHAEVNLKSLRTSGGIFISNGEIPNIRFEALETVHGPLFAPSATTTFYAEKLRHIHGSLSVNHLHTFNLNVLETVGRQIDANRATFFSAGKLKQVDHDLNAPKAKDFFATALEVTKGIIDVSSAEVLYIPSIRESGDIIVPDQLTPATFQKMIFSDEPLLGKNRAIYNRQTNLIKADTLSWMPMDELKETLATVYPSGKHHEQHERFFTRCVAKKLVI